MQRSRFIGILPTLYSSYLVCNIIRRVKVHFKPGSFSLGAFIGLQRPRSFLMLCAVVVFAVTRVILEPHACLNVRTEKPCKKQNIGKFIQ